MGMIKYSHSVECIGVHISSGEGMTAVRLSVLGSWLLVYCLLSFLIILRVLISSSCIMHHA